MPNDVLTGEDGTSVPESKLPSVIRKYMLKLFRGKVLKIGRDNKVYISRDGIKEFAFPAKRIDGEVKEAKMTAGANLDTTLAPAAFLTNTPDDGRHPQATGGWDNFYVMFETDIGIYSGIVKTMVTDRGRVFYDITEIQKEGDPTTHGDNGASPPPARTDTPSINIISQTTQDVNLWRSLPGDIPADIPPGLRKLYRLAQEMSASPPPREIPQRPVQQSPQEILTRLAREMALDPNSPLGDIFNNNAQSASALRQSGNATETFLEQKKRTATFDTQDSGSDNEGVDQDIQKTSPGVPEEIGTVDFSDKASIMEQLALAQKETADLDHEVCYTVTADGRVWKVSGDAGTVNSSAIPSSLAGSYSFHNHPRKKAWHSFSPADVRSFFKIGEQFAKASDYLYEYTMERTEDTVDIDPDVVYNRFKELLQKDVFRMKWNGEIDPDTDEFHAAMEILSRELKFKYERKKTR